MFNLANRTAYAVKQAKRFARGLATAAPRIGDTKVSMSRLEPNAYINYQRIGGQPERRSLEVCLSPHFTSFTTSLPNVIQAQTVL